jgi:hypothetical protein
MLPPPSGEGLILQPRHGRESRTGKPTALKLAHQFNLPLQRHKRPSAGITLQDHHFFAHTSHSFSAIACMKRATSQGALRDVYAQMCPRLRIDDQTPAPEPLGMTLTAMRVHSQSVRHIPADNQEDTL